MWNSSRVNWHILVEDGKYVKDPEKPDEDNWVWAGQGSINMHLPEFWGYLQFADGAVNETGTVAAPLFSIQCAH